MEKNKQPNFQRVAEFVKILHDLQAIERLIYAPDLVRKENDVEHSYHVAMLSWYLINAFDLK